MAPPVSLIPRLTVAAFAVTSQRLPAIIHTAQSVSALKSAWTAENLKTRIPPTTIVEALAGSQSVNTVSQYANDKISCAFGDMLDKIFARQPVQSEDAHPHLQLRMDLAPFYNLDRDLPEFLRTRRGMNSEDSCLFITSADTRTPLHRDPWTGFLIHMAGRKRVVAMPPTVAPDQTVITTGTLEDIYLKHRPAGAPRLCLGELRPGDILFLPRGWWHDVESLDPTISVAVRFGRKRPERFDEHHGRVRQAD